MAFRLNALFNIIAGAAIFLQYLVGVPGYPKIPPGPIILAVAGILVFTLATRLRWLIILGLLAPAFITVGGIAQAGSWARMADIGHLGFFVSTWLQWIFMVLAIAYGIVGVTQLFRRSKDNALSVR